MTASCLVCRCDEGFLTRTSLYVRIAESEYFFAQTSFPKVESTTVSSICRMERSLPVWSLMRPFSSTAAHFDWGTVDNVSNVPRQVRPISDASNITLLPIYAVDLLLLLLLVLVLDTGLGFDVDLRFDVLVLVVGLDAERLRLVPPY